MINDNKYKKSRNRPLMHHARAGLAAKTDFMAAGAALRLLALAAYITIFCTGCATVITRFAGPNWSPPEPALPRIYSGTLFDCTCLVRPEMHDTQGMRGYCLVDMPFSIIGDTVMLPLTIYEQVKYGSYGAGKPVDGSKRPE